MQPEPIPPDERAALECLITHALGDTHQAQHVSDFLLAWWIAASCGGFDLTDLWSVDDAIAAHMVTVFGFLAGGKHAYPNDLGYEQQFVANSGRMAP
ncbi:hypothetical protein AB4Y44_20185 [Paraburkholderia sp. BR10937]|uniref:DUF7673 family protein n=1 Tax=Paraburkholderia sp. BR10937 TaxID=3236994 RepID=UPI0034D16716